MKKILLASVGIASLHTGCALAADLPAKVYTKAPPVVATGFSWTGFYLSGGGGEGFLTDETNSVNATTGTSFTANTLTNSAHGAFGTVSAGYDYQFSNRIVGGVLANYDFSDIKGTYDTGGATDFFSPLGGGRKLDSSWAVGARAGWLVDPKTLTYFNGGYTQAHFTGMNLVDLGTAFPAGPGAISGHTYNGWFLGSGVETKLDFLPGNGWFARTEYRYARYDATTQPALTPAGAPFGIFAAPLALQTHPSVQTVRTELVYKFNTGGGAVSTYAPMPTKAPIMPVSWTGFYIGGGGGYGMADAFTTPVNSVTGTVLDSGANNGASGYFGSVSGGYDYQFNHNIVAGVLANYDFADIHGNSATHTSTFFFDPLGGNARLSSSWAVGARIGWLVTPKTLTYVNGGYTQARYDAMTLMDLGTSLPVFGGASVGAHTYGGWFLGSGVESKLDFLPGNGWFVRTEYRYADYGTATTAAVTTAGTPFTVGGVPLSMRSNPIVQTVRTELSYKFNWGGPVVAKY
jgi:outer membrane immunogenic protein